MEQFIKRYEDDSNYIVSYNEHGYYVIVNRKTLKWFSFNYIMLQSTKLIKVEQITHYAVSKARFR